MRKTALAAAAALCISIAPLAAGAADWTVSCPNGNSTIVEWQHETTGDGTPLINIGKPQIVSVICEPKRGKVVHTIRGLPEVQLDSGEQVNAFLKRARDMLMPPKTAAAK